MKKIDKKSERNYENYVEKFGAVDDISSQFSHFYSHCKTMITWKTKTFRFVSRIQDSSCSLVFCPCSLLPFHEQFFFLLSVSCVC